MKNQKQLKFAAMKITKARKSNATFYHPPNVLREKIGSGGIDARLLEKCEEYIAQNQLDFMPFAQTLIARIDALIEEVRKQGRRDKAVVEALAQPMMELKANGEMFRYRLLTEVAGTGLDFLENIKTLNDDGLEILIAHQAALHVIINNQLRGDGGAAGRALAEELYSAARRYYNKHGIK